ncbi:hypothetical protein LTR15_005921 [Elasticomyces elasticus]|nr:hypothetical protein LTR15_005921 [Elasticomyces elasticus]
MSGVAEAATVYSLVTGTIDLIKTAIEIWEAVKDKDKLPRQLRVVAEKLPSIQQLLATSEQQYQLKRVPDTQWATAKQNVERCRTGCDEIRGIFDKAFPSNANAVHRAWTGTVTVLSGRGKKAEELFREVYQELEILDSANDKTTYQHIGTGPLSVNPGPGTQHVNTNSGSGNWFQGSVNNPIFQSVVHYPQSEGESSPNGVRKRFLDSLWFPDIDRRHHEVLSACPNTLEWIFTENPSDCGKGPRRPWASFAQWLRSKDSMYWISGKPGSGKSTLMAHLLKDHRTVEALESWAGGSELLRLNYFFWRPGSALQNSVEGLLRTVAFQLCNHVPGAVAAIMREPQYAGSRLPSWTEKTLVSAIKTAIEMAESSRQYISIFIDGLDEFLGEHEELVDLIFELQAFSNVKCCVASRPEPTLNERLKHYPHLRLQELNRSDIDSFVAARLVPLSRPFYNIVLVQMAIVGRAEGVFLWAVLVTQSVIESVRSGDCPAKLLERIAKLPKKLEHLFARLVENIKPVYRESLAFYLRCVVCISGTRTASLAEMKTQAPNIALLTAARLSQPIESYAGFAEHCRQTELQVIGHCAGLLEIKDVFGPSSCPEQEKRWHASDAKFFVPALLGERTSIGDNPGRRQSRCEPYPYPEILYYGSRFVGWIHRSAYDYLFPTDGQPSPAEIDIGGHIETLKLMAQTAVELWMIMPSFAAVSLPSNSDQQHEANLKTALALCAELAYAGEFQTAESVMNVLYTHVSCLDPWDMPSGERNTYEPIAEEHAYPASIFWFPIYQEYPDYLTSHFNKMVADLPTLTQLASMLVEIGNSLAYEDLDDQGVALFRKHRGGWSSCTWRGHCMVSSPALLRLRLLELISQRARPLDAGTSTDRNEYKTFLRVDNIPSIAIKCIPSMIQLDSRSEWESGFFMDLIETMWQIMRLPAWHTGSTSKYFESYGPNGPELNRETTNGLWSLFAAVKARLYVGVYWDPQLARKPWPYRSLPEHRLMLRVPWELILSSPGARYPRTFIDVASEPTTVIPLDLSILCAAHIKEDFGESYDSIEFHLRADVAETLASMLAWAESRYDGLQPHLYGSDEEFDNLLKSVSEDIW